MHGTQRPCAGVIADDELLPFERKHLTNAILEHPPWHAHRRGDMRCVELAFLTYVNDADTAAALNEKFERLRCNEAWCCRVVYRKPHLFRFNSYRICHFGTGEPSQSLSRRKISLVLSSSLHRRVTPRWVCR